MNPLKLSNAVTHPESVARCQRCGKMDDPALMFPVKFFSKENGLSTKYSHMKCLK